MKYKIDDLVGQYFKLKDQLDALNNQTKKEENEIKRKIDTIKGYINQKLDELGVESTKTSHGTAFKSSVKTMKILDWNAALEYLKQNKLWNVLNKSLSKTAVQEVIKETNSVFPGVELGEIVDVKIRRN